MMTYYREMAVFMVLIFFNDKNDQIHGIAEQTCDKVIIELPITTNRPRFNRCSYCIFK